MLETIITLQCGLARRGLIPTTNVADVVACDLPMVTDGFYEALDAGSVVAAKGEIARFEPEAVVLTGGERVRRSASISPKPSRSRRRRESLPS